MQVSAFSFHRLPIWRSVRRGPGLALAFGLAFTASVLAAAPASAQVLQGGVEGGVAGAIIGGIIGGGRGAGTGAAIGAGVGLAAGAAQRNADRRAYYGDPYYGAPPPPPGPPPATYSDLVVKTQIALNRLGYNPGPVDGIMGPGTASAISRYQYAWGLPVTGVPSYPLLHNMWRHGG